MVARQPWVSWTDTAERGDRSLTGIARLVSLIAICFRFPR